MSRQLRLLGKVLAVFVMMLGMLHVRTATATDGVMCVDVDTKLTEDHNGPIEIESIAMAVPQDGFQ